jgi:hypothetical protein
MNAIISLFKRKLHTAQVKKLTNVKTHIPFDWNLKKYVDLNKDLFELETHYKNWITTKKDYPCLFIKGQSLYKHRDTILKFLKLPMSTAFLSQPNRSSDWLKQDKYIKQGLYSIYGSFNNLIELNSDIILQDKNSLILKQYLP